MNTKAPMWLEYIQFYTRKPEPPLALPPRLCAIRLSPRTVYHRDGRKEVREQFSHMIYTYAGEQHGFLLLRTPRGAIIGRKVGDVRFAETTVETKAQVAA